jgi:hypothetical protein
MHTAQWTKKPSLLNDQLLMACTAATIIVTAETNNDQAIDLLRFVDHLCNCLAH